MPALLCHHTAAADITVSDSTFSAAPRFSNKLTRIASVNDIARLPTHQSVVIHQAWQGDSCSRLQPLVSDTNWCASFYVVSLFIRERRRLETSCYSPNQHAKPTTAQRSAQTCFRTCLLDSLTI